MNLLFLLSILSCNSFATTQQLSQLITNARTLALDAASSTRQRFTDAQITEFLNQGQRQAISLSNCLQKSTSLTLSPGTTYYSLPSDFVSIQRVWRNTSGAVLEQSPASLDAKSRGWNTVSGTPTYYFIDFSTPTKIGFAPWPAVSSDTDTYTIDYNAQAADLSVSTDLPYNGIGTLSDYQPLLAYYAASIMEAIDNQPAATAYMQVFTTGVQQLKNRCRERPNYNPSMTGVP